MKMFTVQKVYLHFLALIVLVFQSPADGSLHKAETMYALADSVVGNFVMLFLQCLESTMPNDQYIIDNLHNFINYPSRTTIGFAPKYTGNRKFFANLLSTGAFKEMLEYDEEELKRDVVKKMRYCDRAVMDPEFLKEFYDREVDQTRI